MGADHRSPHPRCVRVVVLLLALAGCTSERGSSAPSSSASDSITSPGADPTTTASTTTPTTTTTTTTPTTTLPPTTTTTLPIVTAGGIVKVANASGVNGAASRLSTELAAIGFDMRDPVDAAGIDKDLALSKVYVKSGSEEVAASIARLMGGVEVFRMPTPAWIKGGTEGLGDATVLVMLGHDLAGAPDDLPGYSG